VSEHPAGDALLGPDPEAWLAALWDEHSGRVQAYLLRRSDPDTAQDLLSETFLVAWRRIAEVPDAALPWLLVVARNLAANAERAERRRHALATALVRLERAAPALPGAPEELVVERDTLLRALAGLAEAERESLLLVAWDGLSPAQAAEVAGCSRATLHVRLHRARRRMLALASVTPPHPLRPVRQPATPAAPGRPA